ncbi:3'-5' exonuclease [Crocinitomicaceae bacterium]|jgi:DNA polymerase-3 subunit epsilon|nr:3'-5' exonuclease [Crocinitomicaceae bacterium]MDC0297214.1 3'-5' exonuclease [Crocinitomicaceae bacterium]
MNIQLVKPLCVFDLETTGLNISKDRIVQIAILKIHPSGNKEELNLLINPEMTISDSNSAIHGVTNEMVKDAPTFKEAGQKIVEFIGDSDLAGYNSNKFDVPVLAEEFLRVDIDFDLSTKDCVDIQNIFHKMEQRTLVAAYKFYCSKELINAHDAMADTVATWEVFEKQLEQYDNLQPNIDFLADFSRNSVHKNIDFAGRLAINENNEAIYNFGKHKGKTIKEISISEPGYYGWMLEADFPRYTKKILLQEMEKIKAEKKEESQQDFNSKLSQLQNKFKE